MLLPALLSLAAAQGLPAALRRVDARGTCAIVLSLHQATTCELSRFEHAVRTRPRICDVVALYNTRAVRAEGAPRLRRDATFDGFLNATRALRSADPGVHVVPFEDTDVRALLRSGYTRDALEAFSPAASRFSKVVWFVWGARQQYRTFWFAESDVLVESPWSALVTAWPLSISGGTERLVCASQVDKQRIGRGKWAWARPARCNFCKRHANAIAGCLLALSGYTKGLVDAVDEELRAGRMRAHHEVFVPSVCTLLEQSRGGGRACSLTGLQLEPRAAVAMSAMRSLLSETEACRVRSAMAEESQAMRRRFGPSRRGATAIRYAAELELRCAAALDGTGDAPACNGSTSVCAHHPAKCKMFRHESLATATALRATFAG